MKTFKGFTLAVSLATVSWQPAMACWGGDDPAMDNHFHCVKEMPSVIDQNNEESARFWAKYTGQPYSQEWQWGVSYLSTWMLDDEDSSNLLIQTLREQGKTEALDLLRLIMELYDLQNGGSSWDYKKATPAQYEDLLRRIDALKVPAELTQRKTFLKMRCLFSLKDYNACMRLWDNFASKWEPSPLRQRMEGYVAGVYYRRKEYDKAIPMFFELGDDRSIQLCVNNMLSSTSIAQEYQKDPNSMLLSYIVEDYANYYYHACHTEYWEHGKDNPIWTMVTDEVDKNIALAKRIAKEGKAKDQQMWQAFAGFLQMVKGDEAEAYATLTEAEHMRGGGIVTPFIGQYKLAAAVKMEKKIDGFEPYLLAELKNRQAAKTTYGHDPYSLFDEEIYPHIEDYMNATYGKTQAYVASTALTYGATWQLDRAMTLDEAESLREYLGQTGGTPLEQYLRQASEFTAVQGKLDEMIATKLMREDRYEEAIENLERVPLSYIKMQSIAPYLSQRTRPNTFERVNLSEPAYDEEVITENYKLNFCKEVMKLKNRLDEGDADERAAAALELGKWLYQASAAGDLWALSEYSWSTYGPSYNELTQQAIYWLKLALNCTGDYATMVECHYGLAAAERVMDNVLLFDDDNSRYIIATSATGEGYSWLKKQTNRSHPLYSTCDWLKLYVEEVN